MSRTHDLKIKLVSPSTIFPTRPFKTFYYGSDRTAWTHRGSASSPANATKAALRHILDHRCELALIHGPGGEVVVRVWRTAKGIHITGV